MTTPHQAPLVACVNASDAIVQFLADLLQLEGFRPVTLVLPSQRGPQDVIDFLAQLGAQACIYNVSPPYEEGWATFEAVRQALPACGFVVTTTNKPALDELVGPTGALEVIGKPYDIDHIVAAVHRALPPQHGGRL